MVLLSDYPSVSDRTRAAFVFASQSLRWESWGAGASFAILALPRPPSAH